MKRKGLLIEYHWCTGCHTCEVACKQEHNFPVGVYGIKLSEIVQEKPNGKIEMDYVPIPTELCDLCAGRVEEGRLPACMHHCQAACMKFGDIEELAKEMADKPKTALFAPK
jgi:Fe-S-cluster-containing dehydrogenase component